MPQLSFKSRFVAPILTGDKRQTLRKATRIEPGMVVQARCRWSDPPFATLRVADVERVMRDDLTELDAADDGFESLAGMLGYLDEAYGRIDEFVRISFELEAVDQERARSWLGDHPGQAHE